GKTYLALDFGKRYYKNCVYFNLEDSFEISSIFERDFDPERIVRELSVKSGQNIFKNDTLIILDEIQSCERALTSLKYFCEKSPEYHIIAAGSLLGVALNREKYSFPVGKVEILTLYPLDFEEFLHATGNIDMSVLIREKYSENSEFSLHKTAMDLYKKYLIVGGMPRAVLEYIEKQDYNYIIASQKNINDSYLADMAKYATPHETTKIMAAFNSIPAQLAKDNRKFQYKVIKSGARSYDYETPLDWLKSSGIIIKCVKVNEAKLPLLAFVDNASFKVYMLDPGLLNSKLAIPPSIILSDNPSFNNFKGAITENYVASALLNSGNIPYYWESQGKAEIDFVIQDKNGAIIPIEVKSANNVKAKSLSVFISKYKPDYSIRISSKNFGFENGIKSVPLYAVFCINN
ncbi:MAG: ATP-binding protein, partial [Spirochaetes bacterium]|nr:ATP-binding protein [Spirochaetota bacterium]